MLVRSTQRRQARLLSWRLTKSVNLLVGLLFFWAAPAAAGGQIRFAVATGWVSPFILLRSGELSGGLLYDLMEQVAREAGAEARYVMLPPRRAALDMSEGRVDIQCLVSPAWRPEVPAELWSHPLLKLEDVLLAGPTFRGELTELLLDVGTAPTLKLGVVAGHRYPGVERLLEGAQLEVEAAPSLQTMFEKLMRGRTDLAVSSRLAAVQFNKDKVAGGRVRILQTVDLRWGHCVVSARSAFPAVQLLAVVNRVAQSNEWRETQMRYQHALSARPSPH